MIIVEFIFKLAFLIFLLSIPAGIVLGVIELIIEIKCIDLVMRYRFLGGSCWGMKGCNNDTCRLKRFCHIYQNAVTPEDVAEMERMLEERRKELEEAP